VSQKNIDQSPHN
jgi:hypothetical protein